MLFSVHLHRMMNHVVTVLFFEKKEAINAFVCNTLFGRRVLKEKEKESLEGVVNVRLREEENMMKNKEKNKAYKQVLTACLVGGNK